MTHKNPKSQCLQIFTSLKEKMKCNSDIKANVLVTDKSFLALSSWGQKRTSPTSNSPPFVKTLLMCFISWIRNPLTCAWNPQKHGVQNISSQGFLYTADCPNKSLLCNQLNARTFAHIFNLNVIYKQCWQADTNNLKLLRLTITELHS